MTEKRFSQHDMDDIVEARLAKHRRRSEQAHAQQIAELQRQYDERIAELERQHEQHKHERRPSSRIVEWVRSWRRVGI